MLYRSARADFVIPFLRNSVIDFPITHFLEKVCFYTRLRLPQTGVYTEGKLFVPFRVFEFVSLVGSLSVFLSQSCDSSSGACALGDLCYLSLGSYFLSLLTLFWEISKITRLPIRLALAHARLSDPSVMESQVRNSDDNLTDSDSLAHLKSGTLDEDITDCDHPLKNCSSEMAVQEGLRERFPSRKRETIDHGESEEEMLQNSGEFPSLPEPSDPSLFKDLRADGEAALAAGMEFLSETTEKAQRIIQRVITDVWKQTHFQHLPDWLKDNDHLHFGHRPQIQSFKECFKSIFRIHTETGNIWTHMIGCIAFVAVAAYFLAAENFPLTEKWMFSAFFAGAVLCLGFSFLFHTVYCHSQSVGKLFSKLDYCGIALLTLGSFVPWLHFGFYCRSVAKYIYIGVISVLAISAIVVSLWDKFGQPAYRALRAGVFVALGLSGVIPAVHYVTSQGWVYSYQDGGFVYLVLMGVLYVSGAVLYACRVPERWLPGRCDIWFQSHQIFHVLVVIAAFVHFHGISLMASNRSILGACPQISDTAAWITS